MNYQHHIIFSMFIVGQIKPSENQFVTWTQSYSYDAYNQMIWTKSNGSTVTNKYKAEGMRNQIIENDTTRNFIYVYSDVILEYDEKGNTLAVNTYGHNLISRTANNQTMYYLYNAHGDVVGIAELVGKYSYDAFGNDEGNTLNADNPYRYAGYRYDETTALYYLGSRMYNPELGRFMQEDTYRGQLADPMSLNLYTYCSNNPVVYVDPDGHMQVMEGDYSSKSPKPTLSLGKIIKKQETTNLHQQAKNIKTTTKFASLNPRTNPSIVPQNNNVRSATKASENVPGKTTLKGSIGDPLVVLGKLFTSTSNGFGQAINDVSNLFNAFDDHPIQTTAAVVKQVYQAKQVVDTLKSPLVNVSDKSRIVADIVDTVIKESKQYLSSNTGWEVYEDCVSLAVQYVAFEGLNSISQVTKTSKIASVAPEITAISDDAARIAVSKPVNFNLQYHSKLNVKAVVSSSGDDVVASLVSEGGTGKGKIAWPPNGGAVAGTEKNVVLTKGYQFDRYGYDGGTYVAPVGTPYEMRALPPGTELKPYKVFEVVKPVRGTGSVTAPWFEQPGGGIQFELEHSIEKLLELKRIKEVTR